MWGTRPCWPGTPRQGRLEAFPRPGCAHQGGGRPPASSASPPPCGDSLRPHPGARGPGTASWGAVEPRGTSSLHSHTPPQGWGFMLAPSPSQTPTAAPGHAEGETEIRRGGRGTPRELSAKVAAPGTRSPFLREPAPLGWTRTSGSSGLPRAQRSGPGLGRVNGAFAAEGARAKQTRATGPLTPPRPARCGRAQAPSVHGRHTGAEPSRPPELTVDLAGPRRCSAS